MGVQFGPISPNWRVAVDFHHGPILGLAVGAFNGPQCDNSLAAGDLHLSLAGPTFQPQIGPDGRVTDLNDLVGRHFLDALGRPSLGDRESGE